MNHKVNNYPKKTKVSLVENYFNTYSDFIIKIDKYKMVLCSYNVVSMLYNTFFVEAENLPYKIGKHESLYYKL